jgi:MOSC domain-containing protein YiiM
MAELEIVQINVGQPQYLAPHPDSNRHRDRRVTSSIVKRRITGVDAVGVDACGLYDNHQADLRVHGGVKKAIYAYPFEHLEQWGAELGSGVMPGESFGENLTVRGALEEEVFIGDTFRCGDVMLRVTGARRPCYKLARHMGDAVPLRMIETGRCGWYFSVLVPGMLPTRGGVLTRITQCEGVRVSVAQVFAEKMRREPGIPGPRDE